MDGVQMADLMDVATGAAWAEAASDGSDEQESESVVVPVDSTLKDPEERVLLLLARTESLSEEGDPGEATTSMSRVSLASLESQLASIAVSEDVLISSSQVAIESVLSKLTAVKTLAVKWAKLNAPAVIDGVQNDDFNSLPIDLRPFAQRSANLLRKIDFEIALCDQFRTTNANYLQVNHILNDDISDSISLSSNILSSSESQSEVPELSTFHPAAYIPSHTQQISKSSSASYIVSKYIPANPPSVFSADGLPSRTSSAMFNDFPGFANYSTSSLPEQAGGGGSGSNFDIFKWVPLPALSGGVFAKASTEKFGMPTLFAVSSIIVIGTSRSMILIYDLSQALRVILGDLAMASELGAISALAISSDHTKVAAGYSFGAICVWDISKKQAIKTILPYKRTPLDQPGLRKGHFENSKIVHLSFVGSKIDLISADNEGSTFYHSITSLLMLSSINSTQLAGNQPIYSLIPLPKSQMAHGTDYAKIIAVATPFRLTLMRLKPVPSVFYKISSQKELSVTQRTGVECANLAWRPSMIIPNSTNSVSEPLLAASFGTKLSVFEVSVLSVNNAVDFKFGDRSKPDLEVKLLGFWNAEEKIVGIHWISFHIIALLTSQENILLFDSQRMVALERCSVKSLSLVFHDSFSKVLEGFGITPEMAYFQSFRSYKGKLFLLGSESVMIASLLNWNDRLTNFVKYGDYKSAITMASGFYEGTSLKAVSGLPSDLEEREKVIGTFLSQILSTFVTMTLSNTDFEMSSQDFAFVREVASVSFATCLLIQDEDLLFGEIFELFNEAGISYVFLEELEDYILKERLSVKLNRPIIIHELVNYFSLQGWFARLEQLIVHIDPSAMDLNQVLRLCHENGMYSAMIFAYNSSIKDFVTPLVALLELLDGAIKQGSISEFRMVSTSGYIVFVYLAYIFTGKAFPTGILTRKESIQAKSDLYNFLFATTYTAWPPDEDITPNAQTPNSKSDLKKLGCEPYPYIRLLLLYDSKELFSMLSVAFEDSSLDGDIRLRDGHAQDGRVRFADLHSELNRQFIVDTLLVISHSELSDPIFKLTEFDIIGLYVFIAKAYAKYGDGDKRTAALKLSSQSYKEIFQTLLSSLDNESRDERQNALVQLLKVYNPARTNAERESVLQTCQQLNFWRVAEQLYKQAEQYEMIIQCYLNDDARRMDVFPCLFELLVGGTLEYSQTFSLKEHVIQNLASFIQIDSSQTASLVMTVFPSENARIIEMLSVDTSSQYLYLRGLLEYEIRQLDFNNFNQGSSKSTRTFSVASRLRSKVQLKGISNLPYFTIDTYNLFIQLMVQFEPIGVLPFLVETASYCDMHQTQIPYDFERVLQALTNAGEIDSALWMLERDGQISRALDLVLQELSEPILLCMIIAKNELNPPQRSSSPLNSFDFYVSNPFADSDTAAKEKKLELGTHVNEMARVFDLGLGLCQRKASLLDKWECESVWLKLLDSILSHHNELRVALGTPYYDIHEKSDGSRTPTANSYSESIVYQLIHAFRDLLRKVIRAMVLQVSLPSLLLHILSTMDDQVRFGELRRTVFVMIEEYTYESQLFLTANRIFCKDAHELNVRYISQRKKATLPMKGQCGVCRRLMHIQTAGERAEEIKDKFLVFECQHLFHERCLRTEINHQVQHTDGVDAGTGLDGSDVWCAVCEDLNQNGARAFKASILARRKKSNKGKLPVGVTSIPSENEQVPHKVDVDLEKIYRILDINPSPDDICKMLEQSNQVVSYEDHISWNESAEDTESSSSSSGLIPITRRLPPRVIKVLERGLRKFDLVLDPQ